MSFHLFSNLPSGINLMRLGHLWTHEQNTKRVTNWWHIKLPYFKRKHLLTNSLFIYFSIQNIDTSILNFQGVSCNQARATTLDLWLEWEGHPLSCHLLLGPCFIWIIFNISFLDQCSPLKSMVGRCISFMIWPIWRCELLISGRRTSHPHKGKPVNLHPPQTSNRQKKNPSQSPSESPPYSEMT